MKNDRGGAGELKQFNPYYLRKKKQSNFKMVSVYFRNASETEHLRRIFADVLILIIRELI
jgi:hypothetical protein